MKTIAIIAIAGLALFATAAAAHQIGWGHGPRGGHMTQYQTGWGHTQRVGHMSQHRNGLRGNCPMNDAAAGQYMGNPGYRSTSGNVVNLPDAAK